QAESSRKEGVLPGERAGQGGAGEIERPAKWQAVVGAFATAPVRPRRGGFGRGRPRRPWWRGGGEAVMVKRMHPCSWADAIVAVLTVEDGQQRMQCVGTDDRRQAPIPFDAGAVVGISVRIVLLQEIRLGRGKLDSDRRTGRRGKRERERREHGVELSLREALG